MKERHPHSDPGEGPVEVAVGVAQYLRAHLGREPLSLVGEHGERDRARLPVPQEDRPPVIDQGRRVGGDEFGDGMSDDRMGAVAQNLIPLLAGPDEALVRVNGVVDDDVPRGHWRPYGDAGAAKEEPGRQLRAEVICVDGGIGYDVSVCREDHVAEQQLFSIGHVRALLL